ncbi:DUF1289 domain-containing protein [Pseudomonas sp. GD03721]|nr:MULTISPECIES: DUF1289 domain-containing protein [Pseudomonas]WGL63745.1 DUF1289 domain-containing protein [Pseudomonas sp. CW003PS]MDH1444000.1 DUF1289 domain-containing protein [Pseudomonas sp. GD03722]MDM9650989.1 DUF1289 domain-containing protein [Pseudomonas wenzhouensis]MDV5860908.1 DUF1289 domain-containing protein [Pseudomonas mendocina]TXR39374.1 DUF1289 domain-containing protein [Pseudomonas mendocina]
MSKSPCIKVCEFDKDICLGCGRSRAQIKGWKRLDKGERLAVLAEADMRLLALEATGRRRYR